MFGNDLLGKIHGDLTIENVTILNNNENLVSSSNYYVFDPNPINQYSSIFIDYGKLLQSLHGSYEFIHRSKLFNVSYLGFDYTLNRTEAYGECYSLYNNWLVGNFDFIALKSIYGHEIVNWLRLLPYKILKNDGNILVYYGQLLWLLDDFERRFRN